MQALAFRAYGEVQHRTAGDKNLEIELFRQVTESLETVAESDQPPASAWADAISRNAQMWTVLAGDLVHSGNSMPDEIKRGLIQLSEFVRRKSLKILSGDDGLVDLIDINKSIMTGLNQSSVASLEGA